MGCARTDLHDELNRTDEVSEELEDQVLLLLPHLVETVLLATHGDLLLSETSARVGLELVLGDDPTGSRVVLLLLLLLFGVAVLRLELVDQGVHVLVLLLIVVQWLAVGGGRRAGTANGGLMLLAEVAGLNVVVVDVLSAGRANVAGVLGHGGLRCHSEELGFCRMMFFVRRGVGTSDVLRDATTLSINNEEGSRRGCDPRG